MGCPRGWIGINEKFKGDYFSNLLALSFEFKIGLDQIH